jgi:hypothetical protein
MARKLKELASQPPPLRESSPPIVPEVVEFEDLTEEEERDRLFWERKVERAFYEAGKALKELRDRRLYRSTHRTFEEYCWDRFGFRRRHPYRLIDAATVFEHLVQMCPDRTQNENLIDVSQEMCPNRTQILPTTEYQVRPLTELNPDEQLEAWQQAVEENEGKVPPARLVKDIVQRIRERRPVPNPWRVGDVCAIIVKENPELRGYGGCWAIVSEVHQFSCTVQMWDGLHQVRLENLKELLYSPEQQQEVVKLGDRLSKISLTQLEKPVRDFLAGLGKLDRPWLTSLEETLLADVETAIAADD